MRTIELLNKRRVETPVEPLIEYGFKNVLDYGTTKGFTMPGTTIEDEAREIYNNLAQSGLKDKGLCFFKCDYNDLTLDDFSRINWFDPTDAGLATLVGTCTYTTSGWDAANTESDYIDSRISPASTGFDKDEVIWLFGGTLDDYGSYITQGATQAASPIYLTRQTRRWESTTHQFGVMVGGNRDLSLWQSSVTGSAYLRGYVDGTLANADANTPGATTTDNFRILGGTTSNSVRYFGIFCNISNAERLVLQSIMDGTYTP